MKVIQIWKGRNPAFKWIINGTKGTPKYTGQIVDGNTGAVLLETDGGAGYSKEMNWVLQEVFDRLGRDFARLEAPDNSSDLLIPIS